MVDATHVRAHKRRAHPEQDIQSAIVDYLSAVLPPNAFFFANANASRRTPSGKASNGVPGLTPGVPDLQIIYCGRAYFLEVKTAKGELTESQKLTIPKIIKACAEVAIVRSVDDVRDRLAEWRIPNREAKQRRAA